VFEIIESWDQGDRSSPPAGPTRLNAELHRKSINRRLTNRVVWVSIEPYRWVNRTDDWEVEGELRFYTASRIIARWPIYQGYASGGVAGRVRLNPTSAGATWPSMELRSGADPATNFKTLAVLPPLPFEIEADELALFIDTFNPGFTSPATTVWKFGFRCLSMP
jgi:hypothetical protein